jgi:hypothetical protein
MFTDMVAEESAGVDVRDVAELLGDATEESRQA